MAEWIHVINSQGRTVYEYFQNYPNDYTPQGWVIDYSDGASWTARAPFKAVVADPLQHSWEHTLEDAKQFVVTTLVVAALK